MKLSICTPCMGRLENIKQTLPHNIERLRGFDAELVILNYNSQDGLAEWIQDEWPEDVKSGRILHAHERTADSFSLPHSRNLAWRIATGDFAFSVDADNFLPDGFIRRIFELSDQNPSRLALAGTAYRLRGLVGFWKHDFITELGGYDENFLGYGHDDRDLLKRAQALGFTFKTMGKGYEVSKLCQTRREKWINYKSDVFLRNMARRNNAITRESLKTGRLRANAGRPWGVGKLRVNFNEEVALS